MVRQFDTSTGIPTEVVFGDGGSQSLSGRDVEASARNHIMRNANARQLPARITSRAHDVELGAVVLLGKLVVRTINTQTKRNKRELDLHCSRGVKAHAVGVGQVAHRLGGTTRNTER